MRRNVTSCEANEARRNLINKEVLKGEDRLLENSVSTADSAPSLKVDYFSTKINLNIDFTVTSNIKSDDLSGKQIRVNSKLRVNFTRKLCFIRLPKKR